MPDEVSTIGVRLTLDASGFDTGLKAAGADLNAFQKQASQAGSGVGGLKAGNKTGGQTPGSAMPVDVTLSVSAESLAGLRKQVTSALQGIPVTLAVGKQATVAPAAATMSASTGMTRQQSEVAVKRTMDRNYGSDWGGAATWEKRARGGPVQANRPYVVGEHRAEVFVPKTPGIIEPSIKDFYRKQEQVRRFEYELAAVDVTRQRQHETRLARARFGRRVAPLAPGVPMPPLMGEAPLREGYVRAYHMTRSQEALDAIRQRGLRMSAAKGETYGEPNQIWFSNKMNDYGADRGYGVEAHLPARWFDYRARHRWSDPPTTGGPNSNMAVGRDISRRRIATWNAPWMRTYRRLTEDYGDRPLSDAQGTVGRTIRHLREVYERDGRYEGEVQGWDQFIAQRWRSRHRQVGGPAARALEARALQHFGRTDFLTETGFVTPSGKFLDFSGRHQSDEYMNVGGYWKRKPSSRLGGEDWLRGTRNVDHGEALDLFPDLNEGYSAVQRMLSHGFIRSGGLFPAGGESNWIGQIGLPVNQEQLSAIMRAARTEGSGRIGGLIDVDDLRGLVGRPLGQVGAADWEAPQIPLGRAIQMANAMFGRGRGGLVHAMAGKFRAVAPERFYDAISAARSVVRPSGRAVGETVYQYPLEEYAQMRTYLSKDQLAGYALKPHESDLDLVSVFNVGGRGMGKAAVRSAIQRGATTLDAFDEAGPTFALGRVDPRDLQKNLPRFYSQFGFREVGRDPWNPDYAPEGWQGGSPDVVYMRRRAAAMARQMKKRMGGGFAHAMAGRILGATDLAKYGPTAAMEQNIWDVVNRLSSHDVYIGENWYGIANKIAREAARYSGYPSERRSRAVMAATSPQMLFASNVAHTTAMLQGAMRNQYPTKLDADLLLPQVGEWIDQHLGPGNVKLPKGVMGLPRMHPSGVPGGGEKAWQIATTRDRVHKWLSGPKVVPFDANLGGNLDVATLDALAAQIATAGAYMQSPGVGVFRDAMDEAYRNVHAQLPRSLRKRLPHIAQLQAATWVNWRGAGMQSGGFVNMMHEMEPIMGWQIAEERMRQRQEAQHRQGGGDVLRLSTPAPGWEPDISDALRQFMEARPEKGKAILSAARRVHSVAPRVTRNLLLDIAGYPGGLDATAFWSRMDSTINFTPEGLRVNSAEGLYGTTLHEHGHAIRDYMTVAHTGDEALLDRRKAFDLLSLQGAPISNYPIQRMADLRKRGYAPWGSLQAALHENFADTFEALGNRKALRAYDLAMSGTGGAWFPQEDYEALKGDMKDFYGTDRYRVQSGRGPAFDYDTPLGGWNGNYANPLRRPAQLKKAMASLLRALPRAGGGDVVGRPRLAMDFAGAPLGMAPPRDMMMQLGPEGHAASLWKFLMDPRNAESFSYKAMRRVLPAVYGEAGTPIPRWYAENWGEGVPYPGRARKMQGGGPGSLEGLYVVGEIGKELFVPNRLAHLIPKKVMDQIPKAAGGMQVIGTRRDHALGGELFAPPEDGVIIPNRLMDQVPRAQEGMRGLGRWPGQGTHHPLGDEYAREAARQIDEWQRIARSINSVFTPGSPAGPNRPALPSGWAEQGPGGRFQQPPPAPPMPAGVPLGHERFMYWHRNRGSLRSDWPAADLAGGGFQSAGTDIISGSGRALADALGGREGGFGPARRSFMAIGRAQQAQAAQDAAAKAQMASMAQQANELLALVSRVPAGAVTVGAEPIVGAREAERDAGLRGRLRAQRLGGLTARGIGGHSAPPNEPSWPRETPSNLSAPQGPPVPEGPPANGSRGRPVHRFSRGLASPEGPLGQTQDSADADRAMLQQLGLGGAALNARTTRGYIAMLSASFIGGGRGQQLQVLAEQREAVRARASIEKKMPSEGFGPDRDMSALQQYRSLHDQLYIARQEDVEGIKGQISSLEESVPLLKDWKVANEGVDKAVAKGIPGLGAGLVGLGKVMAGIQVYSMAMQGLGMAMAAAEPGARKFADSLVGFQAQSEEATTQLGKQTREQLGNTQAVMNAYAIQNNLGAGLNATTAAPLTLEAAVKAGAEVAGKWETAIESAIGANQRGMPSGTMGGFGGVAGTEFLAELLGGGKGVIEQMAGAAGKLTPITASYHQRSLLGPAEGYLVTPGMGRSPFQQGVFSSLVADQQKALERGMGSYAIQSSELGRSYAAIAQGTRVTETQDRNLIGATVAALPETPEYENLRKLAEAGIVFTLDDGSVATAAKQIAASVVLGIGMGVQDLGAWSTEQTRVMGAQRQGEQALTQRQLDVGLPWSMWQQVTQNPFITPSAGVSTVGASPAVQRQAQASFGRAESTQIGLEGLAFMGLGKQTAAVKSETPQNYDRFIKATTEAGTLSDTIVTLTEDMLGVQKVAADTSWLNSIRIAERSLGDALGMLGKIGGTRLGYLQREEWLTSRASQSLGLASQKLGLASQQIGLASQKLGLALQARSIATNLAVAQFQAPGETGEERYARQREAIIKAGIERRQLGYSQQQYGISRQQFGISEQQFGLAQKQFVLAGQIWSENARRNAIDASKAIDVMQTARDAEVKMASSQKEIAAASQKMGFFLNKAATLANQAEKQNADFINATVQGVIALGETFEEVNAALRAEFKLGKQTSTASSSADHEQERQGQLGAQGQRLNSAQATEAISSLARVNWSKGDIKDLMWEKYNTPRRVTESLGHQAGWWAAGGIATYSSPTTATFGEAGTETVAILRNPRMGTMNLGGGGGPMNLTININNPSVRNDRDIHSLARMVASEVERSLGRKGELLGLRSPAV